MFNPYFLFLFVVSIFYSCQPTTKHKTDDLNENEATYLLSLENLPEYEQHLDHRRLMESWSEEFYHKGMITYRTVCFNCHGDAGTPGSMPTAAKFWQDPLKNGSDPLSMYHTLTRGYGMMAPQVRLTPQEKYEVIHFIREEFMKGQNPDQYFDITQAYLDSLPAGDTLGPAPTPYQPWAEMDYGRFLMRTYDLSSTGDPERGIRWRPSPIPNEDFTDVNFAYKGIAMRLDTGEGGVAAGNTFALFDHDLLRFTGFWTGKGFIDYEDILLNDNHNIFPRTVGQVWVENPITPGWANPVNGTFEDPRFVALDGRPFGPLPRAWAHYKGLYYHGDRVVIRYTVGEAEILESYDLEQKDDQRPIISRTLNLSSSDQLLRMRVAPVGSGVSILGDGQLSTANGFYVLEWSGDQPAKTKILIAATPRDLDAMNQTAAEPEDLHRYTLGGPAHYPQVVTSHIISGGKDAAYVKDVFTLPLENPWKSRMRPTGIDFLTDPDQAVVCTIDGEVWRLEGISQAEGVIKWHRIATGLFQPLGIKYHEGAIYVSCRDQIVVLRDVNGDGETDYYESFNSDHQVTEHFHEFAMGLQIDEAGNFYYAKSGRHAREALIPQHGTLIRVSPDGMQSEIIATGFRAANGVCINPDGSFIVTDQEGYWNPMNRINWVEEGGFYGNMYGYGAPPDSSDTAMVQPLCWIDSQYDRSPAELLWADSRAWGPLNGKLLSLSYGYGKMFVVLHEQVNGLRQGGFVELPIPPFSTGLMRGRFHPTDGQFYGCGMSAWATNQMIQVGGLYRVRYTGRPLHLPIAMEATEDGIQLTFSEELDRAVAQDPTNFEINTWQLKRSRSYGSKRYDVRTLPIPETTLYKDHKTLRIKLPDFEPTWVMEIKYQLRSASGTPFTGAIQNTVHALSPNSIENEQ